MNFDLDRSTLPRWGWLLLGLFAASLSGNLLNLGLYEIGLPESAGIITVIALMAPVLIYVGVWYDDDRRHYWDHSRAWIAGDVAFVITGTVLGAAIGMVALEGVGVDGLGLVGDLFVMLVGFLSGWGLFWWRNPEMYRR